MAVAGIQPTGRSYWLVRCERAGEGCSTLCPAGISSHLDGAWPPVEVPSCGDKGDVRVLGHVAVAAEHLLVAAQHHLGSTGRSTRRQVRHSRTHAYIPQQIGPWLISPGPPPPSSLQPSPQHTHTHTHTPYCRGIPPLVPAPPSLPPTLNGPSSRHPTR